MYGIGWDSQWPQIHSDDSKPFRINTRNLRLIYNNCPQNWTIQYVKERLVDQILVHAYGKDRFKSRVKAWLIAKKDNEFHCVCMLDRIIEIRRENQLNIDGIESKYNRISNILATVEEVKALGEWKGAGFPGLPSIDYKNKKSN